MSIFSELHIDYNLYNNPDADGLYLLDRHNSKVCFLNFDDNAFLIDYSIWTTLSKQFDMKDDDTQLFVNNMIKKYFKIPESEAFSFDFVRHNM